MSSRRGRHASWWGAAATAVTHARPHPDPSFVSWRRCSAVCVRVLVLRVVAGGGAGRGNQGNPGLGAGGRGGVPCRFLAVGPRTAVSSRASCRPAAAATAVGVPTAPARGCARAHAAASRRRGARHGTSPVACALPRPPHPTHAAFLVAWTTTPFAAARQTRATCSPPRARASVCQHSTVPPRILSFLPPSGLLLVILLLPRWLRCCRCPLPPVSFAPAGSHG